MEILSGTPYLLDTGTGPRILKAAQELSEQVQLLRAGGTLGPETLRKLRDEWGTLQVYESAGIEGNQLDLSETAMAIQRGITISGKPPEHSDEVRHLHEAHQYLEHLAGKREPIELRELREIHALIMGPDYPDKGKFRTVEVAITNSPHTPPHSAAVQEHMGHYAAWVTSKFDVVPVPLLAAVCHAWLVHIHPFRDGNGRTARATMNLLLMRHGYPIVVIRRKDRQRYYEALRASDDGDIGPFMELLTDRCRDSIGQIDRIRKATEGISIALLKVRAADERRYRLWLDGIRLVATAIESAAQGMQDADATFSVSAQRYDSPDFEDYQALCQRNTSGATWIERLTIARTDTKHSLLLWIGYSSDSLLASTKTSSPFPTIWVSMENPAQAPRWILADDTFPNTPREMAFYDGNFLGRFTNGMIRKYESVTALAAEFIAALVEGWFVK